MNVRLILSLFFVLGCASADNTGVEPVVAARDSGVDSVQVLPDGVVAIVEPDAAAPAPWTDRQKCENMCQGYCVRKHMCDGSSVDQCRMAIDAADGGSCVQRAQLFANLSQQRVQACIDAIAAMSCPDFLRMYSTGSGIPSACKGILY